MEEMIFARVDKAIADALTEYAKVDDRKPSYVVRSVVVKMLKDKGFLPADFVASASSAKTAKKPAKKKSSITA